jgi:hypothetical protein
MLDAELEKLVATIVAKPRAAITLGKELFYRQAELGIEATYDAAGRTMACNMMDQKLKSPYTSNNSSPVPYAGLEDLPDNLASSRHIVLVTTKPE